jgi:class 3 adenylate cyclase/pimeloyl-ACP methyl ester carboxylesterase
MGGVASGGVMARPEIQYCTTTDGVSIAYYVMGEGPPLVLASSVNWSHLRIQTIPEYHRSGHGLGRSNRIVRYDSRGSGLSDRSTFDYSIAARVADLEGVVDHLGLERFDLLGYHHGGPGSVAYAVEHPDRIAHLVLTRTFLSGAEFIRWGANFESRRATVMEHDWDRYTLLVANNNIGFTDSDLARRLAAVYREAMTPEGVRALWRAMETIDVRPLLQRVKAPTLALHVSGGPMSMVRAEWMREIASKVPGARLVETRYDPSAPFGWSDATSRIVEDFLGVGEEATHAQRDLPSGMTAILFTDIADSTGLTERLGDAAFRAKARELDGALRGVIREHSGTAIEGKLLGDGVLAVFTSARQAIEAALACAGSGNDADLPLHLGLHAGDVIREDNNVYGGAVNIASRISGLSAAGEVLVSETVRSLARTSADVRFEDRGEQSLRGVGEPVRVWAVMAEPKM